MSENITVWTAGFVTDGVWLDAHEAEETEKRVRIIGGGTFGSDSYQRPDEVNRSPIEALTKLQRLINNDLEHVEWLIDRCGKRQTALDAALAKHMENTNG